MKTPVSKNKTMKISAKQPLIQQMPYKEKPKKAINNSNIKKFYT